MRFGRLPVLLAPALWATAFAGLAWGQMPPAQNDTDDNKDRQSPPYVEIVRADKPAAWWRFDEASATGELNGAALPAAESVEPVKLAAPGPRQEKFPLF